MRRTLIISLFLISATLAVFRQVHDHEFTNYDDHIYVTENIHVLKGLTAHGVIWAFTTTHAANWHPLTWLSHMLDCQLYGLKPGGHHLTSVILHLANTLLLFFLLRKMTGALWRSGFAAALFALHPLHVESVAWVAERKDVLSTLFWLLAIWTYIGYVERPKLKRYLLALFAFTLGLMAKPMVVTLPFVLLLLDYWPLGRLQPDQLAGTDSAISIRPSKLNSRALRLIWEKIPFFLLTAASSVVTFVVQESGGAVRNLDGLPTNVRMANALVSYVRYIGKMLWPQDLAVFYPHPGHTLPLWQIAGAGLVLFFITFAVLRAGQRYPYLVVGWLWYLGTLVPVIGFVQIGAQAMADRYTYIPLVGLFIITAWGLGDVTANWDHRRVAIPMATSLVLFALILCTHRQIQHWRDSITLFKHTLSVTTNNCIIHNNLGVAFLERGEIIKASQQFTDALTVDPRSLKAHTNLGLTLVSMGDLDGGIAHYHRALRLQPNISEVHYNLSNALAQQGKVEEAMSHLYRALEIEPNHTKAHNNLGVIFARQGRFKEAIAHFEKALRLKPDFDQARINLNNAQRDVGWSIPSSAH